MFWDEGNVVSSASSYFSNFLENDSKLDKNCRARERGLFFIAAKKTFILRDRNFSVWNQVMRTNYTEIRSLSLITVW